MKYYLNLGCGTNKQKSDSETTWINLDRENGLNPDIIFDLNSLNYGKLPFKNNYFDYILFNHVIEHLSPDLNLTKLFNELSRISKKGGILELNCPHYSSWSAYELNHKRFFSYRNFISLYQFKPIKSGFYTYVKYNSEWMGVAQRGLFSKLFNNLTEFFANLNPLFCERVWCNLVGGFYEMRFILENTKNIEPVYEVSKSAYEKINQMKRENKSAKNVNGRM